MKIGKEEKSLDFSSLGFTWELENIDYFVLFSLPFVCSLVVCETSLEAFVEVSTAFTDVFGSEVLLDALAVVSVGVFTSTLEEEVTFGEWLATGALEGTDNLSPVNAALLLLSFFSLLFASVEIGFVSAAFISVGFESDAFSCALTSFDD